MKELLIRQTLDELDQQTVQRAEAAVDHTPGITTNLEPKQIRNIMAVADDTHSVAVVDNFIKYQIGRSKPAEDWRFGEQLGPGFGEAVRTDLQWLNSLAAKHAHDEVTVEDLAIRIVRRYLGYLARYFKYREALPGGTL
jgi:hypothetical protein